jgi:hypothetical protein
MSNAESQNQAKIQAFASHEELVVLFDRVKRREKILEWKSGKALEYLILRAFE